MFDIDYRENDVTALDTATAITEQGADSPGAFVVPNHAKYITEINISAGADYTADGIRGAVCAIHLSGSGLAAPESWIGGPGFITGGATNISPSLTGAEPTKILCNIPVVPGGSINCEGFMLSSADPGSMRLGVCLVYDGPVKGKARYFDYREGDTATANTPVTCALRGAGVTEGDFKVSPGQTIVQVHAITGGVPIAGPLSVLNAFHLSGNGLARAGNYKFLANELSTQDDFDDFEGSLTIKPTQYMVNIPCQKGEIRVQQQEIEDDVGTPTGTFTIGFA